MIDTPAQTRTPEQSRRRRVIHDAAAGRTTVGLYICTADPHTTVAKAIEVLSRYADARDWEAVEIILDTAPLTQPLDSRDAWIGVRESITARHIEGVVALEGHTCDTETPTREPLLQWLAARGAFLSVVKLSASDRTERTPA